MSSPLPYQGDLSLPGVTVTGLAPDLDPFAPTVENSVMVDVMRDEWPSREAVAEALSAGKGVFYFYTPEPRAFFGLGRLVPGTVTLFDVEGNRSTFADIDAALRHGFSLIEGCAHG